MNNYRESYAPNKKQRSMLSTTKLQGPCDINYSQYRSSIQDSTDQSQQICVKNQLLKFLLNPTVHEVVTFILWKVCSVEKWVAPHHMLLRWKLCHWRENKRKHAPWIKGREKSYRMERKERKQINPIKNPKGKILHHNAITITHFFFQISHHIKWNPMHKAKRKNGKTMHTKPCNRKRMARFSKCFVTKQR